MGEWFTNWVGRNCNLPELIWQTGWIDYWHGRWCGQFVYVAGDVGDHVWCGSGGVGDDVAGLIILPQIPSSVLQLPSLLLPFASGEAWLLSYQQVWRTSCGDCGWCCWCWRVRLAVAEAEDKDLLWRQQLGVALWVSCGAKWWLLEVRLADSRERMSWLMSRHRRRSTAAGVGDLLWLRLLSVLVVDGGGGYDYCNRRWLVRVAAAAGGG